VPIVVLLALALLLWTTRQQMLSAISAVHSGAQEGSLAPNFTLPTLGGGSITLSQLRGRPVYLNFFTSWCPACRAEAPELEKLHQVLGSRAVIIGVDMTISERSVSDVEAFAQQFGITYPIALDKTGAVSTMYLVKNIPLQVFIDRNGVIRSMSTGQMSYQEMYGALAPLVAHGP
jgi:peroxiredoxin